MFVMMQSPRGKTERPHEPLLGGASVREVIKLVCESMDQAEVIIEELGRRVGDSSSLVADVSLIKKALGFETDFSLEEAIAGIN